jgi:hypothetical protein
VGLGFEVAAFSANQVEAAGARDDPFHLRRLLLGDRHRLALVGTPAAVCRVLDVAEALELLGCERFASFDQVALAADGPGFGGWPQQGTAKGAVVVAGVPARGCKRTASRARGPRSGKSSAMWSGGGGVVVRTIGTPPAWKACGTRSCDGEDGSRQP